MADDIKIVGLSSKKSGGTNWKVISAIIGIVVLSIGVIAGIVLVRQQQDVREKAGGNCESPETIVKCPAPDGNLYSCNPPDSDNNAQISTCNIAGRIELCGVAGSVKEYCCPVAGGAWTSDTSACACDAKAPTSLSFENLSSTSTKLKWTGGAGGKFRLWVSTNADPTGSCSSSPSTCVANDVEITPTTTTEYVLTNLTANTKYYWRIMAWTKSGCDSGSAVVNFTTSADSQATATSMATATATSTSASKTATPTATSTAKTTATATSYSSKTATPTATSKAGSTATAKATATGSATAFPVPETGAEWPTIIGAGFGVIMLLVSLALAL